MASIDRGVAMSPKTFLPSIHNGPTVPVQGEADKDRARAIYELMAAHKEQGRRGMVWNGELAKIALDRCMSQARQGWEGHTSPSGKGPNWWVRESGYRLPDTYGKGDADNNIESLCHGGDGNVEQVWRAWLNSPHHRNHILGLVEFYSGQTNVGVGYCSLPTSKWKHYFCILTVHPET